MKLESPSMRPAENSSADLLDALQNLSSRQTMQLVQRTRRNVMEAALRMRAARSQNRRHLGIVLLVCCFITVLLTPSLWSLTEELFGEELMSSTNSATLTLAIMLLCAIFAVLMLIGRDRSRRRNLQS